MKRSCSVNNLDLISYQRIPLHSPTIKTLRESASFDDKKCCMPSILESRKSSLFKLPDSKNRNFGAVEDDMLASSGFLSFNTDIERVTVSLTALDKEIGTARSAERRSLSFGDRACSASWNLDSYGKSDKIPQFCEDLSVFVKESSFESSLQYFVCKRNTPSEFVQSTGSECSDVDSHGTDYVTVDANTVKDDQDWHTSTDVSGFIEPNEELPCQQICDDLPLPSISRTCESVLDFTAHIVGLPRLSRNELDTDEPIQELNRQLELNEIHLKSRRAFMLSESNEVSPVHCASLSSRFLSTLSSSSRELSVISEHSDGQFEMEENHNTDTSVEEPASLVKCNQIRKSEAVISDHEMAVDVDSIVPQHRRWLSEERSISKKLFDFQDEALNKRSISNCTIVPLRPSSSRNGELTSRCKSQMFLETGNEYIRNWAELESVDCMRNLSTSSPVVNEMSLPTPQGVARDAAGSNQQYQGMEPKEIHKWKEGVPLPFDSHEVYTPVQRTSQAVIVPTREASVRSTRNEKKVRIEKKHVKKSGTLFDFFRKPDLRNFSDVVTPVAERRSTIANGFDGLSDTLAKTLWEKAPNTIGVSDGRYLAAHFNKESQKFIPQVSKPRWADLDLWSEEPPSWSASNSTIKLNKKERKKQDIIYELYLTEKHHCQVLVILQQVYDEGLRLNGILGEAKRSELIPPVLDALLDFHLNFLRRLRQKRLAAVVVDSVSDIVYSEFEKGKQDQAAVHAYTEFCSKYDQCGRLYDEWMMKNTELKKFFDQYEHDPTYKGRTFKMCLLLIAQRLTKYPILMEKINEMETAVMKEETLRAFIAVKKFVMHINDEIAKLEVNRRWDRIRSQIDHASKGRFGPNDFFTYDDLMLTGSNEERHVICIGGAVCQNSQKKSAEGTEVVIVLFEDILLMLANCGSNKYVFHDRGSGSSVIELNKLIVRDVPRSTKLFFLVADDPCYDLFVVSFASKSDVEQWKRAIETTKDLAPKRVKRATAASSLNFSDEKLEEKNLTREIGIWEEKLHELFEKRIKDEWELANYIEKRLTWFETLRSHIRKVPLVDRTDTNQTAVREKLKGLVKQKFSELREARRSSLSRVAERAERIYEDDFASFFDDAYDAGAGVSDSSHSTDQSESDEGRQKLPRRNRTFSGIGERKKSGSIRRHTTEPKMAEAKCYIEEHDSAADDEEIRKLPLLLGPMARRAAVSIIKENAQLRVENNQLQSEIAFRELRIASLRSRRLAAIPANALEALRNKQNELQRDKRNFQSYCELRVDEINRRTKELEEKEVELKVREEQLQQQWIKFYQMNNLDSPSHRSVGILRPTNLSSSCDRSVRDGAPLTKSSSGSSMPLHLAEKTAKISRTKK